MKEGSARILSFFGPPGSGKGTVAQRCVKELGFCMLSTGDLARSHIQDQTEIGKQMQQYVSKGELIPDALITQMALDWVQEKLQACPVIILDGFPRSSGQVEALMHALHENRAFSHTTFEVFNFELASDEIVRRISSRLVCENKKCQEVYSTLVKKPKQEEMCDLCGSKVVRRFDDEPEVVRERLKGYEKTKKALLDAYEKASQKVITFEVPEGHPDVVFEAFVKLL